MQRDDILRMIEQMALIVARIRQQILGGRDASAELRAESARQGVDLELARALDEETLLMLLSPAGEPEPARCWIMAELLYLDGLQADSTGRPEHALQSYTRALRLYLALDPAVIGGIREAAGRMAELEERIRAWDEGPEPPAP